MNAWHLAQIAVILAVSVGIQCATPTDHAGGIEGGNTESVATVHGVAISALGDAVKDVPVRIRSVDYLANLGHARGIAGHHDSTLTDAHGEYGFDSLPAGNYCIEINDLSASAVRRVFSTYGKTGSIALGNDTLRAYASVRGSVVSQTSGSPVAVQVYGLERTVRTDSSGNFTFDDIPAGAYLLRFVSPAADIGIIDAVVDSVAPGESAHIEPVLLPSFGSESYAQWTRSRHVVINTSSSGASIPQNITDFPVCLKLNRQGTAGNIAFDFGQTHARGYDIRFQRHNGAKLRYEIEEWDSLAGLAVVWVLLDTIFGNDSLQGFTMHWGNPEAADFSNPWAVFDTAQGHIGVWHLSNTAARTDATPNQLDAIADEGVHASAAGIAGMGRRFDGQGGMRIRDAVVLKPLRFTVSMWFNLDEWQEPFVKLFTKGYTGPPAYQSYSIEYRRPEDKVMFVTAREDSSRSTIHARDYTAGNIWYHLAAVYDGVSGESRFYIDGVLHGVDTNTTPILYYIDAVHDLYIGSQSERQAGIKGVLDEVRMARVPCSQYWIRLCYENQRPGSTLLR